MLRDILRSGVLMDIADVMDRTADGIQKSRAAPDGIVPVCHRLDVVDVHAVMDHLSLIHILPMLQGAVSNSLRLISLAPFA